MGALLARQPGLGLDGGNRPPGTTAPFKLEGSTFALTQSVPVEMAPALATMLQELVDYRLAAYEVRLDPQPSAATPWNCHTSRT